LDAAGRDSRLPLAKEPTVSPTALPVRELHASTSQLQWVVDAYNLAFGALVLSAGSLSDRFAARARSAPD
jgi:MFS family permease